MSAPAGWYPDAAGAPRWWDGYGWADAYRAPEPLAPQVAPGTSSNTVWIWLIVLLPLLSLIPAFGYLEQMRSSVMDLMLLIPTDGSPPDMERFVAVEVSLILSPWLLVMTLVSWGTLGFCVWFAARDSRELALRGFARPFHWLWALLSPVVYVIGRHVIVHRRGGERGSAPLIVTIAVQVAAVIASVVWAVVINVQIMAAVFSRIPLP